MSEQMETRSLGLWEIRAWTGPWGGKGQENLLLLPSTSWADFPLAKKKWKIPSWSSFVCCVEFLELLARGADFFKLQQE